MSYCSYQIEPYNSSYNTEEFRIYGGGGGHRGGGGGHRGGGVGHWGGGVGHWGGGGGHWGTPRRYTHPYYWQRSQQRWWPPPCGCNSVNPDTGFHCIPNTDERCVCYDTCNPLINGGLGWNCSHPRAGGAGSVMGSSCSLSPYDQNLL